MDDIPRCAASVGTIGIAGGPKSAGPDGPCYSIVSSARARNVGGIVRLSAVLWGVLTGSLRGWSAGSSASRVKKMFSPQSSKLFLDQ